MTDRSWKLEEALDLVRRIEAKVRPIGLFTGLTGSVLYRGESLKDLDVTVSPMDSTQPFPREAFDEAMQSLGLKLQLSEPQIKKIWADLGSKDTKHVEVWKTPERKRIDVFLLK